MGTKKSTKKSPPSNAVKSSDLTKPPPGFYTPEHLDFIRFKSVVESGTFWYASLRNKSQEDPFQGSSIDILKEKWLTAGISGDEKCAKSSLRDHPFYSVFWVRSVTGPVVPWHGGKLHVEPFFSLKEALTRAEQEATRCEEEGRFSVNRINRKNPPLYRTGGNAKGPISDAERKAVIAAHKRQERLREMRAKKLHAKTLASC